jgi:hypothetical protein
MATGMVAAPPCAVCGLASARIELVLTTRSAGARITLERIWQATGRPERGGLNVWRPYEQMDLPMQEAMQHAAANIGAGLQAFFVGPVIAALLVWAVFRSVTLLH